MALASRRRRRVPCGVVLAAVFLPSATAVSAPAPDRANLVDVVAVGVAAHGRAIVLATPGLPHEGLSWRFRSLDTSDIPQPILDVVLAANGTKLFLQPATGPGLVLDLTRQHRHNAPLQYVNPRDLASGGQARGQSHRLPGQRFLSIREGVASVVDDSGMPLSGFATVAAVRGSIDEDGVMLLIGRDGTVTACGEVTTGRSSCRELPTRMDGSDSAIVVRSPGAHERTAPRFMLLRGPIDRTQFVDPERAAGVSLPLRRAEAALRAYLHLNQLSLPDYQIISVVDRLLEEIARSPASAGQPITDWRFFRVDADEELYSPVLQFARLETVFPGAFDTLQQLGAGAAMPSPTPDDLYNRYLRLDVEARRAGCTSYFRTHSRPGSWVIEYWFYYPFDVGGFGSHLHDPEHIFVEVDKLGGAPRSVMAAGHGYMAGNNIYRAAKRASPALTLPLFAIVELGKHAMAPDVDRDGVFTPGVDENEYRERAKIWGVRDVIGSINNQFLAYDRTMSVPRRPQDAVGFVSTKTRFPDDPEVAAGGLCRLQPMPPSAPPVRRVIFRLSDWMIVPPCHDLSSDCAKLHVTNHPDFLDLRTILKDWAFPESFLRATYGIGPRRGLHTIALGYAKDFDRVPALGRIVPLPGRIGLDVFYWRQPVLDPALDPDPDSCIGDCTRSAGVGAGIRYEQFLSNLFGIFNAVRVYSPQMSDVWITFGPFMEAPLGRHSNLAIAGGLSFRPYSSPRFEFRVSVGLWKPKTKHLDLRAGNDRRR